MMRSLAILFALLGVGCPTDRRPPSARVHVRLIVVGTDPAPRMIAACRVWADYLGLSCGFEDSGQIECGRHWRAEREICQLTIGLVFELDLVKTSGTKADSDRGLRRSRFDRTLLVAAPLDLEIAVAHELGHQILDTAIHTKTGVMAGADAMLSADDRTLADQLLRQ